MPDEMVMLRTLLAACLNREGGTISFSEEELENARGKIIYEDKPDKAGFSHLHLLPDYVHTGKTEAEEAADAARVEAQTEKDRQLASMLDAFKKSKTPLIPNNYEKWITGWSTGTTTTAFKVDNGTPVTPGGTTVGTVTGGTASGSFDMKLSDKGWNFLRELSAQKPKLGSIGSGGSERKEK